MPPGMLTFCRSMSCPSASSRQRGMAPTSRRTKDIASVTRMIFMSAPTVFTRRPHPHVRSVAAGRSSLLPVKGRLLGLGPPSRVAKAGADDCPLLQSHCARYGAGRDHICLCLFYVLARPLLLRLGIAIGSSAANAESIMKECGFEWEAAKAAGTTKARPGRNS